MNGWDMLEAVGGIDRVFIAESEKTAAVIRTARRRRRAAALAACLASAVACTVLLTLRRLPQVTPTPTQGEAGSVVTETPSASRETPQTDAPGPTVSVPEIVSEQSLASAAVGDAASQTATQDPSTEAAQPELDGAGSVTEEVTAPPHNELSGGQPLPEQWSAEAPTVRGTGYTTEELDELLRRESFGITQAVAAETGCAVGDVQICADGYCHTSLGETNVVDLDYLTLPVCVGDRIVACVDLFRADGAVRYTVSAGGPRWDNLNSALQYGEVAFVYAGYGELAAAADGTVFAITAGASEAVAEQSGLYDRAAAPQTVYSLSRLRASEKY